MIRLSILGATGSIGRQALDVVDWRKDELRVVALTASQDWRTLAAQARKYQPQLVAIADPQALSPLREALAGENVRVSGGAEALLEAAALAEADTVLAAISGLAGLPPLFAAIDAHKQIALANKEALIAAGELVLSRAKAAGVAILPVDSEHSAIWQSLAGEEPQSVARLILTASGGAFRSLAQDKLATVRAADALQHPTWRMGAKITIDCATMVNKGLEVIEAHWLFGVPYAQIDVVVHPQSIIHSLVAFCDGSVKAQLAQADMRLPIQYALLNRLRPQTPVLAPDLVALGRLDFQAPDPARFPALSVLRAAGELGGTAPAFLSGANEVLVQAFLSDRIRFLAIGDTLARLLASYHQQAVDTPAAVYAADQAGREAARRLI